MPNPSGGRGLYVFDLAAAPEVTTLTLHDRLLLERLLELPAPSPSEIRKVAHEVAIEGAAGRRAAREASAAADADATMGLLTRFHLVTRLLQEAGLESIDWRGFTGDNRELRAMIKGHLAKVAPRLGIPVDGLFERIEAIGEVATPVGPPSDGGAARNEAMLARLRTFVQSLGQWSQGETGGTAADATAVLGVAERAVREAGEAQGLARELLGEVLRLLRGWQERAGEQMRSTLTRPEWLLDGWGQVCGLWEVRRAGRAVAAARDAAADPGVAADARPERPRGRDQPRPPRHPLRPGAPGQAARGLAHRAEGDGEPRPCRAAAGGHRMSADHARSRVSTATCRAPATSSCSRSSGLIDTLDRRGPVDQLLAPVRGRLALLRPPRPITLGRVLILPFEDLLVHEAEAWPGRRCFARGTAGAAGRAGGGKRCPPRP